MTDPIAHEKTPDQHSSIVGGSSASRIIGCPGSLDLLNKLAEMTEQEACKYDAQADTAAENGDDDAATELRNRAAKVRASLNQSSKYADEGTGLHEVMAYLVDNDIDQTMLSADEQIDELFARYNLDDERFFDAVIPAYRAFNEYLDVLFKEAEDAGFADPEILILVEQRVGMPGIDGAFGTADIIIRTPVRSAVWDWKFGAGVPVSSSYVANYTDVDGTAQRGLVGNDQLTFYGRAAQATHPNYFEDDPNWLVDLVICQPRIGEGEPSIYTSTVGQLEGFRLDLIDAVDLALAGGAPKAKGSYCRFASCKSICPLHLNGAEAAADISTKLTALRDRALTVQDLKDAEIEIIPPGADIPEHLSLGEVYALGLTLKETLEPMLSAVAADAQAFLEAGGDVPGWKLVPKKAGHDGWEDPDKAEKFLGRQGIPLEERRVTKPITPAVARTKLKALGKLDDKGAKALAKYVKVGVSSGHTMAPEGDNRPAVDTTASAVGALANKIASLGATS